MKQKDVIDKLKLGAIIVRTFGTRKVVSDLHFKDEVTRIPSTTVDSLLDKRIIYNHDNSFGGLTKHYFKLKP